MDKPQADRVFKLHEWSHAGSAGPQEGRHRNNYRLWRCGVCFTEQYAAAPFPPLVFGCPGPKVFVSDVAPTNPKEADPNG